MLPVRGLPTAATHLRHRIAPRRRDRLAEQEQTELAR
jgi:hypothetical protein